MNLKRVGCIEETFDVHSKYKKKEDLIVFWAGGCCDEELFLVASRS